jgi:hypothetical protein
MIKKVLEITVADLHELNTIRLSAYYLFQVVPNYTEIRCFGDKCTDTTSRNASLLWLLSDEQLKSVPYHHSVVSR